MADYYSDLFSYLIYSLSKKELKGKTKFAIISVKTVKLAMENVHSLFLRVLIGNMHLFKPLKRNIVLIVITPLICDHLCRDHGL